VGFGNAVSLSKPCAQMKPAWILMFDEVCWNGLAYFYIHHEEEIAHGAKRGNKKRG
jgi:hypothetical protein